MRHSNKHGQQTHGLHDCGLHTCLNFYRIIVRCQKRATASTTPKNECRATRETKQRYTNQSVLAYMREFPRARYALTQINARPRHVLQTWIPVHLDPRGACFRVSLYTSRGGYCQNVQPT